MARRRSSYARPMPRAGSVLVASSRRRRRSWRPPTRLFGVLAAAALIAGGAYLWLQFINAGDARRDAVQSFADAWARGDHAAMWNELTPRAREANPERQFLTDYRAANRAAGVRRVEIGAVGEERDGVVPVRVTVRTRPFGPLDGTIGVPVSGTGDEAGIDWDAGLRLPGLRRNEAVRRRSGPEPPRGTIFAADQQRLDHTPPGA